MTLVELLDTVSRGGVVGLLVVIVWGAYKEWWVSGATHRRLIRERDYFRDELYDTLRLADRATRVAERSVARSTTPLGRLELERELRGRAELDDDRGRG